MRCRRPVFTRFPGAPSLVESGVIVIGTACGGNISLSPHPGLPDERDALSGGLNSGAGERNATRRVVTFSSPGDASPACGPAARG